MTFLDSVNTCLKKTLTISGRASRSEFWWFQLSFFVIGLINRWTHCCSFRSRFYFSFNYWNYICTLRYCRFNCIIHSRYQKTARHQQIRLAGFGILAVRYDSICKLHLMDCLHCIYLSGRYSWR